MHISLAFLAIFGVAYAWDPPMYNGLKLIWSDNFEGPSKSPPNLHSWNVITGVLGVNGELESYSGHSNNVQLSGGSTLQLVPQTDSSAHNGWTSGRIESSYTFTPEAGAITMAESFIRFGDNNPVTKQGMWPAFWMLGDSIRHGVGWPACGEVDVLETVNGQLVGHGTMHCDVYPGGMCNEGNGLSSSVDMPDQSWHRWGVTWDRTTGDWRTESLTWELDGQQFHRITGGQLNDLKTWSAVCHSPLFFILNVAVGGSWPGDPNSQTQAGWGAMMEVAYVAVYSSHW